MASNYPTSLDSFTNPTANDSLNSPSHALQHANANDAIEAIEAKLGIGTSTAGSATSGYVLTAGTGGTTTWSAPSVAGLTLVKTQTIGTAVSSITVTDAFSSTYENYLISISGGVGSGSNYLRLTFGSVATGYYYAGTYVAFNASTVSGTNVNNGTSVSIGASSVSSLNSITDVFGPNLPKATAYSSKFVFTGTSSDQYFSTGGYNTSTLQHTDFTITVNTGTATGGTIRVYGYRNS